MDVELREILGDLESLKRSLPEPPHRASIDKVFTSSHRHSYMYMYHDCMYYPVDDLAAICILLLEFVNWLKNSGVNFNFVLIGINLYQSRYKTEKIVIFWLFMII